MKRFVTTTHRLFRISISAVLLLVGLSSCVRGPNWSIVPSRWPFRELTQIRGAVVCIGCRLEKAQEAYPAMGDLYELSNAQGQVVLRVDWVNDAVWWKQIALGRRLWVRVDEPVFQQLTAERNLFQEIEITGLLRSERTLDIASVSVRD